VPDRAEGANSGKVWGVIMNNNRNFHLQERAKELRKNMTPQEKHLWYDYLSKHTKRWYRQRIIDNYIVDFYCSTAKLVVEIDGPQHYSEDGIEYDARRTEILNLHGLRVLRFSNHEVDAHFDDVCKAIDLAT